MNYFKALQLALSLAVVSIIATSGVDARGLLAQSAGTDPGPQHWQIQVDNVSPPGHNWSFNAYYPDRLQAHAGDTITFAVAANPNAFHTVALETPAATPDQGYPGYVFKDEDDDPVQMSTVYFNSKPFFGAQPSTLCGRGGNAACTYDGSGELKSGVLLNPPPPDAGTGQGNPSFSLQLDSKLAPGTYFFFCLVHGPSMSGSIDVLSADQPAQSADVLKQDANREYQADLLRLTDLARTIQTPTVITNPDGWRTWGVAAGGGSPDTRLSVNEFGVPNMVVRIGDTVTWTDESPAIVAHTVTGFATAPGQPPPNLAPFQPVCGGPDPEQGGETAPDVSIPPDTGFPPDVWNDCPPWQQENHLTDYAYPSAPSGSDYSGDSLTSGLLFNADFLSSPIGLGLPFSSSYSVTFTQAGTYRYACMIHYGMTGSIEVVPTPTPQ